MAACQLNASRWSWTSRLNKGPQFLLALSGERRATSSDAGSGMASTPKTATPRCSSRRQTVSGSLPRFTASPIPSCSANPNWVAIFTTSATTGAVSTRPMFDRQLRPNMVSSTDTPNARRAIHLKATTCCQHSMVTDVAAPAPTSAPSFGTATARRFTVATTRRSASTVTRGCPRTSTSSRPRATRNVASVTASGTVSPRRSSGAR